MTPGHAADESDSMQLIVEDDPDPDDIALLEAHVARQNAAATGHADEPERQLAIFVRDDAGEIRAGVYGWTWAGCCELQHLWVDEAERGHGLGTRLLDAAEAEAAGRGCTQVVLFTHAANAGADGERYTRRGYVLTGRVDDYPAGDAALWYRKPLSTSTPRTDVGRGERGRS
jgi:GNAT superfamily N-acetyltransferase